MIVITTPAGQIGRQVLGNLLASGQELRVIARDSSQIPAEVRQDLDVVEGSHGSGVAYRALANPSPRRHRSAAITPLQGHMPPNRTGCRRRRDAISCSRNWMAMRYAVRAARASSPGDVTCRGVRTAR
jgi:nucleoside-diphosphate-sugar epimerase